MNFDLSLNQKTPECQQHQLVSLKIQEFTKFCVEFDLIDFQSIDNCWHNLLWDI